MVTRRKVLASGAATVAVVAWNQTTGTWVTAAEASPGRGNSSKTKKVPSQIADRLVTDSAALATAADDFGHIVSRTPWAVLQANSTSDISTLVRWANKVGLKVAAQGQRHSVFGEGQVDGGVAIDMTGMNTIHEIGSDYAIVDAGVTWAQLVEAAAEKGLTPLVLTDYLNLTVGGVLAVGGIGGNMNQAGMVVDNVDAITVVTGKGQVARNISPTRRRGLFDASLGGLGQSSIITRARVRLGPRSELARIYELTYSTAAAYLTDQRTLVTDGRFDYLEGQIVANEAGGWQFKIEAGTYYNPAAEPDDDALIDDLSPDVDTVITDFPYDAWLGRVGFAEIALRDIGLWDTPHPWSDLFLPDNGLEDYIANELLPRLSPEGVGAGVILLYPFRTEKLNRPFAVVPNDDIVWAFDILRFPFDPTLTDTLLAENRALYEAAVATGGTFYAIGALDTTPREWRRHYGRLFSSVRAAKRRFDPRNVLTPGQGL